LLNAAYAVYGCSGSNTYRVVIVLLPGKAVRVADGGRKRLQLTLSSADIYWASSSFLEEYW
jgi:hypothetical protein